MMKSASRWRWFFVVMAIAAVAGGWLLREVRNYLEQPLPIAAAIELEVARGSSLSAVIRQLAARDIVARPRLLQAYVRVTGRGHHIEAGEYLLGPGSTPLDLLAMLEQGRVRTRSVTLVEGWTLAQARAQLRKAGLASALEGVPDSRLLQAIGVDREPGREPEGLFFPDTYVYSGKTTDRDILHQAYGRMQEVLEQEWRARKADLPYRSAYEALIMASIVERETGAPGERPDIAGVFVRRLQRGMLLQTDPAVIYGIGPAFDGNLRRRDLDNAANLYNTYLHAGLPPTPIALPGRAAIRAALQPAQGQTLFFVAKGDGSHQFSTSLEEHQRAVKKYQLQQRRADYRSRPAAAPL